MTTPGPSRPIRVVVADDQSSVREGLVLLVDAMPNAEVVGSATDGRQVAQVVAACRPDVLLLDLYMPAFDGTTAIAQLARDHPAVAIVVLTTYADDAMTLNVLQAGAMSCLTKYAASTEIGLALTCAAAGYSMLGADTRRYLVTTARPPSADALAVRHLPDGLTQREAQIVIMVSHGLANPDIAAALVVTTATIKSHLNSVFRKSRTANRVALAAYAREHDLS